MILFILTREYIIFIISHRVTDDEPSAESYVVLSETITLLKLNRKNFKDIAEQAKQVQSQQRSIIGKDVFNQVHNGLAIINLM